jgi:hypothetical protein
MCVLLGSWLDDWDHMSGDFTLIAGPLCTGRWDEADSTNEVCEWRVYSMRIVLILITIWNLSFQIRNEFSLLLKYLLTHRFGILSWETAQNTGTLTNYLTWKKQGRCVSLIQKKNDPESRRRDRDIATPPLFVASHDTRQDTSIQSATYPILDMYQ